MFAKLLQIFKPGRHTAMSGDSIDFSNTDIQSIVDNYDPAIAEAPLVVGHPKLDAPAYGWVEKLQFSNGFLEAIPHQIDTAFAEMVNAGRFKKISASFYTPQNPANPTPGSFYLRHVGFLGAQPPAIKGMRDAGFSDADDDGIVTLEFSQSQPTKKVKKMPKIKETHTADAAFAEKQAEIKKQEQALIDDQAAFAEKQEQFKQQEALLKTEQDAAVKREVVEFVEGLVKASKVLPADKTGLIAYMTATDVESVLEFSQADETIKKPAVKFLRDFLTALPAQVQFGEYPMQPSDDKVVAFAAPQGYSVDAESAKQHTAIINYQEQHPDVDYVTAAQLVTA